MDAERIDRIANLVAAPRLSRRRAVLAGGLALAARRAAWGRVAAAGRPLPNAIAAVMRQPRYAKSAWSLLVVDLASGETIYELNPDQTALTGSVRKLFSVGLALRQLGADHLFTTPIFRTGAVDGQGVLKGDLILVAAGDLTLGGRADGDDDIAFTDFDHNDANNLGTAILTPQDPLHGLDVLAQQVRAAGIQRVAGDVVIDDRLFVPFRVPNQNLLVTSIMVNENMVDVTVTPTTSGEAATAVWRPHTGAFDVNADVTTSAAGTPNTVTLSGDGRVECVGEADCAGAVAGDIPAGFRAPLSGRPELVQTFRIENPAAFARTAFIEALGRAGVPTTAAPVAANPAAKLPPADSYEPTARVAQFISPPYAAYAKLILKVSLNLGANLSLMLFGLANGKRTIADALAVERQSLIDRIGLAPASFDFPTNGSGSPDSQATPRAVVRLLTAMA
ncbi:MAG TPA: D-alanyl-D-alanine carboxypeptidase, partial [Thermomicrobiales bacterium]|nr:D-alanyl-D-alanine carboxypeptidase [Thermomicrobiales bacterium]